eukprot:m.82877 g.82877  ORF g.82877 m.82877 type:complete len:446 (-) comp9501_c0_seq1:1574-2911(-)
MWVSGLIPEVLMITLLHCGQPSRNVLTDGLKERSIFGTLIGNKPCRIVESVQRIHLLLNRLVVVLRRAPEHLGARSGMGQVLVQLLVTCDGLLRNVTLSTRNSHLVLSVDNRILCLLVLTPCILARFTQLVCFQLGRVGLFLRPLSVSLGLVNTFPQVQDLLLQLAHSCIALVLQRRTRPDFNLTAPVHRLFHFLNQVLLLAVKLCRPQFHAVNLCLHRKQLGTCLVFSLEGRLHFFGQLNLLLPQKNFPLRFDEILVQPRSFLRDGFNVFLQLDGVELLVLEHAQEINFHQLGSRLERVRRNLVLVDERVELDNVVLHEGVLVLGTAQFKLVGLHIARQAQLLSEQHRVARLELLNLLRMLRHFLHEHDVLVLRLQPLLLQLGVLRRRGGNGGTGAVPLELHGANLRSPCAFLCASFHNVVNLALQQQDGRLLGINRPLVLARL